MKKRLKILLQISIIFLFIMSSFFSCNLIPIKKYTVTFDSQGGSSVEQQVVEEGGLIKEPEQPTKSGYTFGGWYKEKDCTNKWDFKNDKVYSDITLYAKWINTITFTVTFDSQGGSSVEQQVVEEGGLVKEPEQPTRELYGFGGWYKEQSCTNKWDFENDKVDSDITLYAKWIPKSFVFVITVKTDNSGYSNDNQFKVPTDSNMVYNYTVDWGDGKVDSNVTGDITHTYDSSGTYDIAISGTFPHLYFPFPATNGDAEKLIDVKQWGTIQWESMNQMFLGCSNLVSFSATDNPDLSNVIDMSNMFRDATSFNGDISTWDVSSVTSMNQMFSDARSFNQDLNSWDVSNVTDMTGVFRDATSFNGDISTWDVSSVTSMNQMFSDARSFNQDLNSWDVSNVTDMSNMFENATSFNGDISGWDVSNVNYMGWMFNNATSFNGNISGWNVSSVSSMRYMFEGASSFNSDISGWDVRNVTLMTRMFYNASSFNQNLGSWNIGSVTDMAGMFTGSGLSTTNYSNILIGWESFVSTNNEPSGITLDAGTIKYNSSAETARSNLINNHGWTINDGGLQQ